MWGLLIANHLGQSLWSTNQKYWAAVRFNLLHSFLEVDNCVVPFTSCGKLREFDAEKPISWAKPAHFDFLAINFTLWSHILRTVGDALTPPPIKTATNSIPSQEKRDGENWNWKPTNPQVWFFIETNPQVWFFDAQTITFHCLYTTTHQSPNRVIWNVSRWHVAMKNVWTTQRLSTPPTKKKSTYMWPQIRVMRFWFCSR